MFILTNHFFNPGLLWGFRERLLELLFKTLSLTGPSLFDEKYDEGLYTLNFLEVDWDNAIELIYWSICGSYGKGSEEFNDLLNFGGWMEDGKDYRLY